MTQSESEYLNSISDEADNLKLDLGESSTENPLTEGRSGSSLTGDVSKQQAGAIEELVPGLSHEKFEELLKNNYMGSYLFYKRLDTGRKNEVYSYYLQNPDPGKLREKILQLKKR